VEHVGPTLFDLRPKIEPAISGAPSQMKPLLVDERREIEKAMQFPPRLHKNMSVDGNARRAELERDVPLCVGEQVTEQYVDVKLDTVRSVPSRGREVQRRSQGTFPALGRVLDRRSSLVTTDGGCELKGDLGVVPIEVESDAEPRHDVGPLPKEVAEAVVSVPCGRVQPK